MIFCDGIILSQHHKDARTLTGFRSIRYRETGDINRDGHAVAEDEVINQMASWAWIQGSHSTAIRVKSFENVVALAGNPGRWGKPDNLFGHDLAGTVEAANGILHGQGLPGFTVGEPYAPMNGACDVRFTGARVWSIHLTRNYATGSQANAEAVINWLDTQSVAKVKKARMGASTVVWGSLKYCQTEAYIKADEMLAHAKGEEAKQKVRESREYQWARENGIVRVEVKAAKDYLREKGLTYLGAWDMGTVHRIFEERTEVLRRVRVDAEEFDLSLVPGKYRITAAAWLAGQDVAHMFNARNTLWRHAKALRAFGIDICQPRNVSSLPVRIRTIDLVPCEPPQFYRTAA